MKNEVSGTKGAEQLRGNWKSGDKVIADLSEKRAKCLVDTLWPAPQTNTNNNE